MKNEFLRLIASPMMNATNVYRYSGIKLSESENLAEHTYETIMLGYMIIHEISKINPTEGISLELYLHKALHHDMEETLTGDVARPLKYHNSDVKRELNKVGNAIAEEMYMKYFSLTEFVMYWRDAKTGKEGAILKIVDMLVVAFKAVKEVKLLGNMYFMRVVHEIQSYLIETGNNLEEIEKEDAKFSPEVSKYLMSIVQGAIVEIVAIQTDFGSRVKDLGVIDRSIIT